MKKTCPVQTDKNQGIAAARNSQSSGIAFPAVAPFQMVQHGSTGQRDITVPELPIQQKAPQPQEAWHVVQQKSRVQPVVQMRERVSVNDDVHLEQEADVMGEKATQLHADPVVQRFCTPVSVANSAGPVIQLYKPKPADKKKKFLVKRNPSDLEFITATFEKEIKDVGWVFKDGQGKEFTVANQRNIKQLGEEIRPKGSGRGKSGKNKSYYNEATFAQYCQYPGCKRQKRFKSTDELHGHIRKAHPFPKLPEYPYTLFGGQSASTHSLIKEGEEFIPFTSKTGQGFHSEWRHFDKRGTKRKFEEIEEEVVDDEVDEEIDEEGSGEFNDEFNEESSEEFSEEDIEKEKEKVSEQGGEAVDEETESTHPSDITFTTSLTDFMSKGSSAPGGLFLTGDPHCGICSVSLDKAGLPVTYPTKAKPITSPMYNIPVSAPNQKNIKSAFPKPPDHTHSTHLTYGKGNFPRKLETRQSSVDRLRRQHSGKDKQQGEQYIKFVMQSMNLNRIQYNNFFGGLNEGQGYSRDQLKQELTDRPIPQNPYTFDLYCPSPIRPSGEEEEELQEPPLPQKSDKKPSGSQKAEKEPSRSQKSEKEGAPKKSLLDELVASIDKAFRQFDPERFKMRKKDEAFFDPVSENNCLITAINGGTAASADDVLMIRYLIFDQLDIPYGEFLPASPEVIYIIVKTLRIKPARIEIFMSGRRSAAQVFIVTGTYNVVELEGDEAERQEEEEDSKKIPITHSGGNHFSYRRGRRK